MLIKNSKPFLFIVFSSALPQADWSKMRCEIVSTMSRRLLSPPCLIRLCPSHEDISSILGQQSKDKPYFQFSLVSSRHGRPSTLHPPDREGIAQSLMGQVVTSSQLSVHVIALQNLVQKVNVARCQLQGLDLAQFVRRERWDYLTQWGKGVVERLRPLALPDVGNDPLAVWVLEGGETSRARTGDRRKGRAWRRQPMLRTPLESFGSSRGVDLDFVPWLYLAIVCWCGGRNCCNLILHLWAHLPFMPSDPWCCYNDRTGVRA